MSHEKKEMMNRALNAMTINIGKSGVNDNVIEEIKRQLKANEIVKLKLLFTRKSLKHYKFRVTGPIFLGLKFTVD